MMLSSIEHQCIDFNFRLFHSYAHSILCCLSSVVCHQMYTKLKSTDMDCKRLPASIVTLRVGSICNATMSSQQKWMKLMKCGWHYSHLIDGSNYFMISLHLFWCQPIVSCIRHHHNTWWSGCDRQFMSIVSTPFIQLCAMCPAICSVRDKQTNTWTRWLR